VAVQPYNMSPGSLPAVSSAVCLQRMQMELGMESAGTNEKTGLAYWMKRVLSERQKVRRDLAADPVHDLRVALRRCLSICDVMREIDPDPNWKSMRKEGRRLFRKLGDLRDVQVIQQWVEKLSPQDDSAGKRLREVLAPKEMEAREAALSALKDFDRKEWRAYAKILPRRFEKLPLDGPACEHLALERWNAAFELHGRALQSRSRVAFHRLRIGLKRFRYTVENFLPHRHLRWGGDLKQLQDLLGEAHDLDVLWQTAVKIRAFSDKESRAAWRARIEEERKKRLDLYREKMAGKNSLFWIWRAELPQGEQLEAAGLAKLAAWGAFCNPETGHAQHVAQLVTELYDGLAGYGLTGTNPSGHPRNLIHAAALLHDVGLAEGKKSHHKASYRMIRALAPPIGWSQKDLEVVALAARYHRRALPRPTHKGFQSLPPALQQATLFLGGVVRLANAFDWNHDNAIAHVSVENCNGTIAIYPEGYSEEEPLASRLAGAKHLLEIACHRPVLILPPASQQAPRPVSKPIQIDAA